MAIDQGIWDMMQNHLGYTDEEMALFKADPRNERALAMGPELMSKTIVAEVIESHGCNSQHKVGDKLYFDGAGNLLTKLCPKRICIYAIGSLQAAVFAANELLYAGVDPNEMLFKRMGCGDVGVQCGGWGRVKMEIRVEDRKKV